MEKYISKSAVNAEIKRLLKSAEAYLKYHHDINDKSVYAFRQQQLVMCELLSFLDTLEVKEVDLELITGWFDHIAQIADDRMTLTNQRMTDAHALDEIKCLARNSSEFIKMHYKAQKGE